MNIGAVAARSGVSAKTIRYYESIGLIPPASRSGNGYRHYSDRDVQTLAFILRARSLGFSVEDVSNLLELWRNKRRPNEEVRTLAHRHLVRMKEKIRELESVAHVLEDLVERCQRGDRPHCPILEEIVQETDDRETVTDVRRREFAS